MKTAWFVVPLCVLIGCSDAGPAPRTVVFPADDPGVRIPAASPPYAGWQPVWHPQSGRLVFAVHTGLMIGTTPVYPLSFSILSYDPASPTQPTTLASRVEGGGFQRLKFASQTGTLYYAYYPSNPTNGASLELSRIPAEGGTPTVVPTPTPLRDFFISTTESRLLSSLFFSSVNHLTDPSTGAAHGTLDASSVRAMSPDASEVLIGNGDKVVTIATGATRDLAWKTNERQAFVDAAWIGGSVRVFFTEVTNLGKAGSRFSAAEWDEATGRSTLGSVESAESYSALVCAAWSPSTRAAVLVSDSLFDFTFDRALSHRTIVAMSNGTTAKIGSQNFDYSSGSAPTTCALSPDGKWFAYQVPQSVYLKAVK